MHHLIENRDNEIAELCRHYHVRRLDLFGSAARGTDFDPDSSDIDLLIDYEPAQAPPSLSEFLELRDAFAALFDRRVDLVMASGERNPFIREDIDRSRETLYAA